jgi:hypothetical protein
MNNLYKNIRFGGTALVVLLASSFATAYGQGNNQPSGQAGGTGTSNVVVTNSPAQPVPVKEQNNPAFQPFQWQQGVSMLGVNSSYSFTIPVPAGKRLVIEQISGYFAGNSNGTIPRMSVGTHLNGALSAMWIPLTNVGADSAGGGAQFNGASSLKMYADGGTNITVWVSKSVDAFGQFSSATSGAITISGYLVNIP